MKIRYVIWKEQFVEKIQCKHSLNIEEVEDVLNLNPHVRKLKKGNVAGEDLYVAYGRTSSERYIVVFFIYKKPDRALPISARGMTYSEKKYYEKAKK